VSLAQIMATLGLSDLQISLAAIGALILLLVLVLNMRYARARRKSHAQNEVALDDHFVAREPSFGPGFADASNQERLEPSLGEVVAAIESPLGFTIDPRIDCVITLRFDQAIAGSEILAEMKGWSNPRDSLLVCSICEGLNADLDAAEQWEPLQAAASYSELQLAAQLASRRGAIGVLELSDFCSRAQALADTLGSQIDMPSVSAMLEAAKELDAIAAESDIQLSINVAFDHSMPWANFDSLMRQRGFKLARNGRQYEYLGHDGVLFKSADFDPNQSISQLTLLLDVPLVSPEERAFERMLGEGVEIAQEAHGRLVDDNGSNLTENAVITIRQHLDLLYSKLEKAGISAGSSAANRLFS